MGFYIIEINDKYKQVVLLSEKGELYCKDVAGLMPYTEPEPHAEVTADAYHRGYENGFIAGHLKAEKSGQSFYEDGYKRGLNDAWEAARKICLNKCDGGLTIEEIVKIFYVSYYRDAYRDAIKNTPHPKPSRKSGSMSRRRKRYKSGMKLKLWQGRL